MSIQVRCDPVIYLIYLINTCYRLRYCITQHALGKWIQKMVLVIWYWNQLAREESARRGRNWGGGGYRD